MFGAFLCMFLGRDGGPRSGAIKLPMEKVSEEGQVDDQMTPKARPQTIARRVSSYFSLSINSPPHTSRSSSSHALHVPESPSYGTHASTSAAPKASTPKAARSSFRGTSYGYDPRRNSKPWSRRFTTESARRGSMGTQYAPDFEGVQPPDLSSLNFAQRLLLANEPTVVNISDLWVQACAAQTFDEEAEDVSRAEFDDSVFDQDDETADQSASGAFTDYGEEDDEDQSSFLLPRPPASSSRRPSSSAPHRGSQGGLGLGGLPLPNRPRLVSKQSMDSTGLRARPRIFSNTGLVGTPALFSPSAEPQSEQQPHSSAPPVSVDTANPLTTIHEQRQPGQLSPAHEAAPLMPQAMPAKEVVASPFKDLPTGIILQYFIVAFHSMAFDQVFGVYLVTPVNSGGLGLTASHFAELVAALFFAQMFWQFYVYGNVGPPNGKMSHLAMLRLGMCIHIPSYLLFPLLRSLLHDSSNFFVMTGMIVLASIRILGNVFAYTALMVLVNISTPPHLLGLSNALAQSGASAARFLGPIVGASVWSWSIDDGPAGRPWPFNYHFGEPSLEQERQRIFL